MLRRAWRPSAPPAPRRASAARSRGLGTVWTTFHTLHREREAAEVLGIDYDAMMQVALIPVAYTKGTDFKPAKRKPLETFVRWV